MKSFIGLSLVILCGFCSTPESLAHFHILLPSRSSCKKGEEVIITYMWGHPFEHQLFDAPMPAFLSVMTPDSKRIELSKDLNEKSWSGSKGQSIRVFSLSFKPSDRGDYVFLLKSEPIWMEEEQCFIQDEARMVLHVQSQKGWDSLLSEDENLVPLTRPYGLTAGVAFQSQVLDKNKKGMEGLLVEIERYNEKSPKSLPADEYITRSAKTDPNGVVTATLSEPGWWCVAAYLPNGARDREGKKYPLKRRLVHWVYVDERGAR